MTSRTKPIPGSVYPNGRGKFIAQEPMNADGKRPSETFETEADGWEHLTQLYAQALMRRGKPNKVSAMPLQLALTQWVGKLVVKESTKDTYRNQLRPVMRHPDVHLPLRDVTEDDVETLIRAATPGNARIKVILRLGQFFRWAVRREYITRDPFLFSQAEALMKEAEGVAETKRHASTGKAWTLDEMREALASIERPYFRALMAFMLVTGARRGEAAGLAWGAIDGNTARIARNLVVSSGKIFVEPLPKTRKPRTAYFGPNLAAMIEGLRPARCKADGYVFVSGKFGEPLTPDTISQDVKRLVHRMGFTDAGATHALRRTFATVLDEQDCPETIRETLLGHAVSRYAVARPDALQRWAEIADKLFLDGIGI